MSVPVEAMLGVIEALAQMKAQHTPIRERLRQDAIAQAEMRRKVDEILKQWRPYREKNNG